jgi:hypothetical protein
VLWQTIAYNLTMVREYIFLASGCVAVGVALTLIVLAVCQRLGINIEKNLWLVAIPAVLSLILNVSLLELYRKYRKRK